MAEQEIVEKRGSTDESSLNTTESSSGVSEKKPVHPGFRFVSLPARAAITQRRKTPSTKENRKGPNYATSASRVASASVPSPKSDTACNIPDRLHAGARALIAGALRARYEEVRDMSDSPTHPSNPILPPHPNKVLAACA